MFPDLPPRRNTPLRIVSWSPEKLVGRVYLGPTSSATCAATSFSVRVEEPDLADATASMWFIDRTDTSPSFNGDTDLGGTSARIITAPPRLLAALGSYVDSQRHVVEVFVTDGQFTETVGIAKRAPVELADGGLLQDAAYVDSKAWFVDVQRCE